MANYQYVPLSDGPTNIRLVTIVPGQEKDLIQCTISTYKSGNCPRYQALSYTWGDVAKKRPISLNGCTFFVTHNLEDALRSLRCSSSTNQKPFWIDAICIDQKNHGEKKVQIQRMTSIYRDADQVVIWLGNYYDPRDDTLYEIRDRWGVKQLDIGSEELTSAALHIARVLGNHLHEHPGKRERSFLKWFEVEPFVNRQAWAQLSKLFWRP
jgi:hypothetical protein